MRDFGSVIDIDSVVIDIDGTLLKSKELLREGIKLFSKVCSGHPLLDSLLYSLCSSTWFSNTWFSNLPLLKGKQLGRRLDRLIFNLFDFTDRGRIAPYKGVREVLEYLFKNGVRLFATTVSKTHRTAERLSKLGLLQFFTVILGGDIIPKEDHIFWFAKFLGISPKEFSEKCFWVGDTTHDMILAEKFGIFSIGITNTLSASILERAGAKKVIKNWEELLELLK